LFGDKSESSVEAKQEPMADNALLLVDSCVALCIDTVEGNCWGSSSPLISVTIALIVCFHVVGAHWNRFACRTISSSLPEKATSRRPRSARMVGLIAFGRIE
jgi:hypothetical protein